MMKKDETSAKDDAPSQYIMYGTYIERVIDGVSAAWLVVN